MGSLRDLQRESKTSEAASDTVKLYSRLNELVIEYGNAWKEIAKAIEAEGYRERGEVLTHNALRKRYTRWKESGKPSRLFVSSTPPGSTEPAPLHSPIPGVEELISINKQLLAQIQESNRIMQWLEKRLEEQEQKTSHTGVDTEEQPVTSRDLLELLKEITSRRDQMIHIEEQKRNYVEREEVQQLLQELITDGVDAELRTMLNGEPVRNLISGILDERLKGYMQDITVKEAHRGPGRGKLGRTHKKFSASLPEDLFAEVKSLPGMFSAHLDASLRLYLKMLKGGEQ